MFDRYKRDSLKEKIEKKKEKRKGIGRKVDKISQPLKNWHAFLRMEDNKFELSQFFSKTLANINLTTNQQVL